jgi:hypothetical protein
MRLTMDPSLPSQTPGEARNEIPRAQDDFWHVSGEGRSGSVRRMETEIRKDSYRRSRILFWLILASLVGLFGLVSFLYHHPEVQMPHLVGRLASVAFCGTLIPRTRRQTIGVHRQCELKRRTPGLIRTRPQSSAMRFDDRAADR